MAAAQQPPDPATLDATLANPWLPMKQEEQQPTQQHHANAWHHSTNLGLIQLTEEESHDIGAMGSGGKEDLGGENSGDEGQQHQQKRGDVRLQESQPRWTGAYRPRDFELRRPQRF